MKKVLFATTALVATAGVAAADVAVSGGAEMGLFGGSGTETQFFTDIDVTFTLSGTTDNGLTFGAAVDLDEGGAGAAAVADNADDGGVAIFLSGDFGTVTLGDTDGALDWALTEAAVGNAGSINDDETGHSGYLGSYLDGAYDGQILRYNNTFGDFGVAVSVEMDDSGALDEGYAIGFRYGMDLGGGSLDLGLGYQTATFEAPANDELTVAGVDLGAIVDPTAVTDVSAGDLGDVNAIGLSAVYSINGLSAGVAYTVFDGSFTNQSAEFSHLGLGVGYTVDAITVSANWGRFDGDFDIAGTPYAIDQTGWGVAAAYDLGGGASVHVGYGSSEDTLGATSDSWSFGVAMSF